MLQHEVVDVERMAFLDPFIPFNIIEKLML
jgi:hypothetical protein